MGLWTNITRLAAAAANQNQQNPGPVDVLTPAQAVQVIDDVSHTVRPVPVPHGLRHVFIDASVVAGQRAAVRYRPGPRGSVFRNLYSGSSSGGVNTDVAIYTRPVGTFVFDTGSPGTSNTAYFPFTRRTVPLHTVEFGTVIASPTTAFGALFIDLAAASVIPMGFYVDNSQELIVHGVGVATDQAYILEVQDVPDPFFEG